MSQHPIPSNDEMYRAILARDSSYEGIFITAVKTTGIFCRPSCPAKKPHRENVEFFSTPLEAMQQGYRACKRCTPLQPNGDTPPAIRDLLQTLGAQPTGRLRDHDLRQRGMDSVLGTSMVQEELRCHLSCLSKSSESRPSAAASWSRSGCDDYSF